MNKDLLKQLSTALGAQIRAYHFALAGKAMKGHLFSDVPFPLTPALSPGERGNRSPVQLPELPHLPVFPFELPGTGDEASKVQNTRGRSLLSPLPEGEGQGEAKPAIQESKPARKPESLPL